MKIIEIGTFDDNGSPIYWSIGPENGTRSDFKPQESKPENYCLGIIDDKVYVNGVEIVKWTEKRLGLMEE